MVHFPVQQWYAERQRQQSHYQGKKQFYRNLLCYKLFDLSAVFADIMQYPDVLGILPQLDDLVQRQDGKINDRKYNIDANLQSAHPLLHVCGKKPDSRL